MVADGQTGGMSQTSLSPARTRQPIPWRRVALIALPIAVVMAVLFGVSLAQDRNAEDRPAPVAQQSPTASPAQGGSVSPAAAAVVDPAELAAYWRDACLTSDQCDLVTTAPAWDGSWLTVRTDLFPDSDAKAPAVALCGMLSGFWIYDPGGADSFRPVRVLDKAGKVLVSRRSVGEQCA